MVKAQPVGTRGSIICTDPGEIPHNRTSVSEMAGWPTKSRKLFKKKTFTSFLKAMNVPRLGSKSVQQKRNHMCIPFPFF